MRNSFMLFCAFSAAERCGDIDEDAQMVFAPALAAWGETLGDSPEKRLQLWLDNYNERGSFDDRTLVVMRFDK